MLSDDATKKKDKKKEKKLPKEEKERNLDYLKDPYIGALFEALNNIPVSYLGELKNMRFIERSFVAYKHRLNEEYRVKVETGKLTEVD